MISWSSLSILVYELKSKNMIGRRNTEQDTLHSLWSYGQQQVQAHKESPTLANLFIRNCIAFLILLTQTYKFIGAFKNIQTDSIILIRSLEKLRVPRKLIWEIYGSFNNKKVITKINYTSHFIKLTPILVYYNIIMVSRGNICGALLEPLTYTDSGRHMVGELWPHA